MESVVRLVGPPGTFDLVAVVAVETEKSVHTSPEDGNRTRPAPKSQSAEVNQRMGMGSTANPIYTKFDRYKKPTFENPIIYFFQSFLYNTSTQNITRLIVSTKLW